MTMIRRAMFLAMVTVGVAVAAMIYLRVGVDQLFPMVGEGPFSVLTERMNVIVPVVLLLILAATAVWVIAGGVQEERTRTRRRY